ncbi:stalk domain-containing protein [Pseudobacteroides cellulosolvens]|uniref:Copper amine oxidase-like domain-containing protein n=1 Tax=Pseudobacteroides cellulosolvens ATCC 35603 = DSM 2933 TaxID=398512 RepID=A0A0L6JM23_9FIRM|nr:stalk domain-containing protein [Pseudobacteroides cellulosolvens]KNY26851.1 copper amine oxidase-like domain-containing protein [Pseudobacteroides cellulosolvens ATCC 35603 = DSM 2933]
MFKRIISNLLMLCILVSIAIPATAADRSSTTDTFKSGFSLTPVDTDSTGISPDTGFTLSSQNDVSLEVLKSALSIDGEPAPLITASGTKKFNITPSRPLFENSLYIFRLKLEKEITWSFQTRQTFRILGTLPTDQSVNVPVNSGIEINFSHEDFSDIGNFFEISPKVEGRFEIHKKTAVFVPKKLEEGILYTVRIKKGLTLKNTSRSIDEDYVFTFETYKKSQETDETKYKGHISYIRNVYDYKTNTAPQLPISFYVNNRVYKEKTIDVSTKIYAYKSFDSFYDALNKKLKAPDWAIFNGNYTNFIPVDNLDTVQTFKQTLEVKDYDYDNPQYISVPKELPMGYYVIDSYWNDMRFQTFVQITDTCTYIMKSNTKTLVWVNDLSTKLPIEGAKVSYSDKSGSYLSDAKGIAQFDTPFAKPSNDYKYTPQLITVSTKEGNKSVFECSSYGGEAREQYWSCLYTDRAMYQPEDTISLWGFLKNRYEKETIKELTVELNNGYRSQDPILRKTIDVSNGFYEASIKLPMLDAGGYNLQIKHKDLSISSTYVSVYKYTKPSYKIDITKDKQAVFPGEEVNYSIKSSFFEGTGVSNLKLNYFIQDYSLGGGNKTESGTTDAKGIYSIKYTPVLKNKTQGQQGVSLNIRALLPESGEISESDYLTVFVNDINVDLLGEIKDGKGTVTAAVNKIVLDRLNNGTAKDSSDFLGTPVGGKNISGTIYKNTWVEKEDGEYYDFINKVTQKKYRYEMVKTAVKDLSMTTSADGKASFAFDAPKIDNSYYTAELKCMDNSGKEMNFEVYIGQRYEFKSYPMYDGYNFDGGKDSYSIGESIDLTLKKGKDNLPEGSYLFIKAQNGIREYTTSTKPLYKGYFTENDIPNVSIKAVYFDGRSYNMSREFYALYKYEDKKLLLDAKLDKDSYKPGENVTIKINVKDLNGKAVKAFVNSSIVDEAYLKLADQSANLLETLYSQVSSGISAETRSHIFASNVGGLGRSDENGAAAMPTLDKQSSQKSEAKADMDGGQSSGNSATVRQDFRDTAHFESVMTDESGHAEIKFKLPDNVTSWRVTLGAISEDLHAGSDKVNMNVSLPFFINYSFNTTYIEGDKPVIGVNAYGDSLKEDDVVLFEVSSTRTPNLKVSVAGKAFERVNIPLWNFTEGIQDLIIKASTNSGLEDSLKHTVNVVKSYYEIDKAVYFDVSPNTGITGGKSGNTRIIFRDKSQGKFLSELISSFYSGGNRIDQKVSQKLSSDLLLKYFKDYKFMPYSEAFTLGDYQKSDGGLSLLPYSQSNSEISAKLTPLVKDYVDVYKLKSYFKTLLDSSNISDRIYAIYGLAALKEPILLDLEKAAAIDNLSLKDSIYLALSYCELGETDKAKQIYDSRVSKYVEEYKPFFLIDTGNDKDDILELTSICAYLASKLGITQKNGLFEYCIKNHSKEVLLSIEKLLFIINEIDNYSTKEATFTYNYNGEEKNINLNKGGYYVLELPSANLSGLRISDVQGDVSAVSIFKENVIDITKTDKSISVDRKYFLIDGTPVKSNNFKQGDMVKVKITWSLGSKAFDGVYEITDYLPSGLKPVENYTDSPYYFRNMDGQKVKFYVYDNPYFKNNYAEFEYLARVVSPGTYTAQGTVIQSGKSKESINTGKTEIVNIDSNGEVISTPIDPNGIKVQISGRPVIFDSQPVIKYSRTLVPLRSIFEVLGADVKWDSETQTVTAVKEGKTVVLTINKKEASIDGNKTSLEVPAMVIGGRTFVPTRFISESMGAKVTWNAAKKTVFIDK